MLDENNIRVLFLAIRDFANVGSNYCKALRSIGIRSNLLVSREHGWYDESKCSVLLKKKEDAIPYVKEADVIHFLHGGNPIQGINLKGKKIVVQYTGSNYRNNPQALNRQFNPIVDLSIVGSSLFGKGAKNEHWTAGGVVDTNFLKPVYERSSKNIIAGHFHPSSKTKGSGDIVSALRNNKINNFEFRYETTKVSWLNQIKRVSKCDIYIERFTRNTGFGMSALEAAALGKIVITTYAFKEKFEKTIDKFELISISSIDELVENIRKIVNLSEEELLNLKKKHRNWVERNFSYSAVGNRLLNIYRKIL